MFRGIPSRTNPPPAADQLLPHHAEHNLAGHEFAPVEIRLDGQAERSAAPRDRAAVRRSRYGGCRSARQFVPSAAAAVSIGGYRHLLASRATLRHPGTAAAPATNSPAATDTPT